MSSGNEEKSCVNTLTLPLSSSFFQKSAARACLMNSWREETVAFWLGFSHFGMTRSSVVMDSDPSQSMAISGLSSGYVMVLHSGFQSIRTMLSAMRKRRPSSSPVRTGRAALLQAVRDNPPIMTRATIPMMNRVVLGEKVRLEMLKFIYSGDYVFESVAVLWVSLVDFLLRQRMASMMRKTSAAMRNACQICWVSELSSSPVFSNKL